MAGYSGTPLVKKLGLKAGVQLAVIGYEPADYLDLLGEPPAGLRFSALTPAGLDFIHAFCSFPGELQMGFPAWKAALRPTGMLWISWPRRAGGHTSLLDENLIREVGLGCGLVDVKVCAVDQRWSGLKFVYRLKDR